MDDVHGCIDAHRDMLTLLGGTRRGDTLVPADGCTLDAKRLPQRVDRVAGYAGHASVLCGHPPRREAVCHGRTLCVETVCACGGKLSDLRRP